MLRLTTLIIASFLLTACNYAALEKENDPNQPSSPQINLNLESNNQTGSQPDNQQLPPPPMDQQPTATPAPNLASSAVIVTSLGDITIKLFPDKAPLTVSNFAGLATGTKTWNDPRTGGQKTGEPLYNNTIFHRVIANFMIQGGDPLGTGTGGPGYKFQDEIAPDLVFDRPYLLAMANSGPNTNGSQFFITVAPTPWLNGKHTIFGEVVGGQEIVDQIATAPTDSNDRPLEDITIKVIQITP